MGMGESLANLDNLIPALDRICSVEGLGMGQRRVTISTVGLPDKMRKLAADLGRQLPPGSLAPRPDRGPAGRAGADQSPRSGSRAVVEAADAYFRQERPAGYVRVRLAPRGINDGPGAEAAALADLARSEEGPCRT